MVNKSDKRMKVEQRKLKIAIKNFEKIQADVQRSRDVGKIEGKDIGGEQSRGWFGGRAEQQKGEGTYVKGGRERG